MSSNAPTPSLNDLSMCIEITLSKWGNRGKGDVEIIGTDADKNMLSLSKALLSSPEHEAVSRFDRETVKFIRNRSVASGFKEGIYRLRRDPVIVEEVITTLETRAIARQELVDSFLTVYESQAQAGQARLASQANSRQYPARSVVASKFSMSWHLVDFSTPASGLTALRAQAESQKLAQNTLNAFEEIMGVLRGELAGMVTHLCERLTPESDGKAKTFQKGSIDNILEFIENLRYRNVTGDTDLEREVGTLREILSGVSAPDLRSNEAFRETIRTQLDASAARLDDLVVNVPRRRLTRLAEPEVQETVQETVPDASPTSPVRAQETSLPPHTQESVSGNQTPPASIPSTPSFFDSVEIPRQASAA